MANTDRPSGAKPVRSFTGAPYSGAANMYATPAADGTPIFVGDFVTHAGTAGAAGLEIAGRNAEGMPMVVQSAAGDSGIVGVVVGIIPDPTAPEQKHRSSSTNRILLVADDPQLIFEMQENSSGCTLTAANVGLNADIIVSTGNSTTGVSAMEINSNATAGTGTANVRLLRLVPRSDNAFGSFAKWEVFLLESFWRTPTGV